MESKKEIKAKVRVLEEVVDALEDQMDTTSTEHTITNSQVYMTIYGKMCDVFEEGKRRDEFWDKVENFVFSSIFVVMVLGALISGTMLDSESMIPTYVFIGCVLFCAVIVALISLAERYGDGED